MNITTLKTENGIRIEGLQHAHIEALQQLLSTCALGADMLRAMSTEEASTYFQSFTGGERMNEHETKQLLEQELEAARLILEVSESINTIK